MGWRGVFDVWDGEEYGVYGMERSVCGVMYGILLLFSLFLWMPRQRGNDSTMMERCIGWRGVCDVWDGKECVDGMERGVWSMGRR